MGMTERGALTYGDKLALLNMKRVLIGLLAFGFSTKFSIVGYGYRFSVACKLTILAHESSTKDFVHLGDMEKD